MSSASYHARRLAEQFGSSGKLETHERRSISITDQSQVQCGNAAQAAGLCTCDPDVMSAQR